jgi:hypothetical protein
MFVVVALAIQSSVRSRRFSDLMYIEQTFDSCNYSEVFNPVIGKSGTNQQAKKNPSQRLSARVYACTRNTCSSFWKTTAVVPSSQGLEGYEKMLRDCLSMLIFSCCRRKIKMSHYARAHFILINIRMQEIFQLSVISYQ